jgi:hypothetical protein
VEKNTPPQQEDLIEVPVLLPSTALKLELVTKMIANAALFKGAC